MNVNMKRKGFIIPDWTIISTIVILLLNNIHSDILIFKNIPEYKANSEVVKHLRNKYCLKENPTSEEVKLCIEINEEYTKQMIKR